MRRLKKIGLALVGTLIALLSLLYIMQEKLIFLPTTLAKEYTFSFEEPFREVTLSSDDGALINAIHFTVNNPKGVLLYFHGNAGDLSRWGEITSYFTQYNYDVFVIDYRGYGKSTGSLSEKALYDDAQLAYDFLLKKDYSEDQIVVYGRSLGTTFATFVAAENNPKQLILETPFYSLTNVAKKRFPFLPVKKLLRYKFPTHSFIPSVSCPTTIFHGTSDAVVAYDSGKKLSEVIPLEQRTFVTIPDGEHNNLINFEKYRTVIATLLK